MRWTHDTDADALYIELSSEQVSRTEQVEPLTLLDLDRFGNIVGIEILRPAREWPLEALRDRGLNDPDLTQLRLLRSGGEHGRFHHAPQMPVRRSPQAV